MLVCLHNCLLALQRGSSWGRSWGCSYLSHDHRLPPWRPCKQVQSNPSTCIWPLLQVGMPTDKAQYIHRVGRTARAGKQVGPEGVHTRIYM